MIYIKISDMDFYDDAVVLIKSFYPRTEVMQYQEQAEQTRTAQDIVIEPEVPEKDGRSKKELHEAFKCTLYTKLSAQLNKTLPWGYLTGVRPSKIAYTLLEKGADREQILEEFTKKHLVSEKKAQLALQVAQTEKSILEKMDYKNGYSLYIGIPFCPTTCLYCSFTSYSLAAYQSKVQPYLEALLKEMKYVSEAMRGRRLDTVYFGGGTPTRLSAGQLDMLLTELDRQFDLSACRELTVEAGRPDSITWEKLAVIRKHPVTRISINPQTMNQKTLDIIGRRHTVEDIRKAFADARELGFDNINMDLIVGLPGEGIEEVEHTMQEVLSLDPDSITVHSLAIKRAARLNLFKDEYKEMTFTNNQRIMEMTEQYASKAGMFPYYLYRQKNMKGNFENVGYAKPEKEGIYNILIMEEKQSILALGAGASTKFVMNDRIERAENVKDIKNYIERIDEMIERKKQGYCDYEKNRV